MRRAICWALLLLWPLLLWAQAEAAFPCRVVLEEAEGVTAGRWVAEVQPGEAAVFELRVDAAYAVTGADYEGAILTRRTDGGVTLTLPDVRYSEAVRLNVVRNDVHLTYHANGGVRLDGGDPLQAVSLPVAPTHQRLNTSLGTDLFACEGCTLTGWNSAPDGSGLAVGLGSRVEPGEGLILYAQWASWAAPELFRWEPYADGVTITGYLGKKTPPTDEVFMEAGETQPAQAKASVSTSTTPTDGSTSTGYLGKESPIASPGSAASSGVGEPQPAPAQPSAFPLAIPAELDGKPVRGIASGAFANADCGAVVLPDSLWSVADGAFDGSTLSILVLFDSIREISDYAFPNCPNLRTLHVNAALPPVYSGTYYASFADKFDQLCALRDARKLVLFSGSSARFGYDSAALDAAFPEFEVVNMGVFAYTNALPQLELIRGCMGEGDVLLHSPEFDAIQRQFCVTDRLDAPFFNMMEANYDMLALLDLREYGQVFTALHAYLKSREGMEPRSYDLSPADFDEDGNPVAAPSYNEYGDYALYRPNATDDAPVYGLPVDYTPAGYPQSFLDSANAEYRRFLDMGVRVYVTYAPRNRQAVSETSTPEARAALDTYLREGLCVPLISNIEDSLVSGTYLYGTDNHLSTEGVRLRTQRIIEELRAQLAKEDGDA